MRLADWEARLSDYLTGVAGEAYSYGQHDCALFAAGAVLAMTGNDPAVEFRGRYSTAAGSLKALKKYGAGDLEATIASKFEAKPIGFAQRGDLVMHAGAVGVCIGADALLVTDDGLTRVPRADWAGAFAV